MISSSAVMEADRALLKTKRLVLANVALCFGCCCGQTGKGKPEVPLEWIKKEWKLRGLLKNVQLTVSGCLGPCDIPNVVRISTAEGEIWLGQVTEFHQYRDLVDWASRCKLEGCVIPLPREFEKHAFDPYIGR